MKKTMLFFFSLFAFATGGFADNIVLDNQSAYPMKNQKSKIAIQWASSAKEVEEGNSVVIHGGKLNANSMEAITQSGKINLTIPKKAQYFRILAWSKGEGEPDLLTNWVDVVPDKTYTLKADHLSPAILMLGTGC